MAIKIIGSTIIDDSRNIVNAGIATVTSVSIGNTQVVSSARQLQNIASLDATTTATIEAAIQNAPNTFADLNVTGISTLGVTSATNLTAQQLNISGVSTLGITTFTGAVSFGTSAYFGDNDSLNLGDSNDLQILHDGANSVIKDVGTGNLVLAGDNAVDIYNSAITEVRARFLNNAAVELYYDNSKKFETTGYGATVFGTLQSQQLNVSGISTISVNSSSDVLRITQTGSGNALVVEDETSPDSTPFVVTASGAVGIGTTNPQKSLHIAGVGTQSGGIRLGDLDFFAFGTGTNSGSPTFRNSQTNGSTTLRVLPNGTGNAQFEFFGNDYFQNTNAWDNIRIVSSSTEFRIDSSYAPGGIAKPIRIETNVSGSGLTFNNPYQLYLDTNGNIGIGTSATFAKFNVQGNTYVSGSVGVGTTNPGATLNVVPTSTGIAGLFSGTTSADMVRITQLGTGNALVVEDETNPDASPFVVTAAGAVGVGTTNPSDKLHVLGNNIRIDSASGALAFWNGAAFLGGVGLANVLGGSGTDLAVRSDPGRGIIFFTGGANDRGRIDANGTFLVGSATSTGTASQRLQVGTASTPLGAYVSGNLGVGVTNPGQKFEVSGNIQATGSLRAYSSVGSRFVYLRGSDGSDTGAIGSRTSSDTVNTDAISWTPSGLVGIGSTAPTERLDVGGNIKLTGAIYGPAELIIDPAAVGDNTGAVRIKGDLYVDGTQFIVNSTTIELADFNVGIATTVGTNSLLDGAGIGIGSTNIRKTITWNNTAGALTSSEDWNLASGKVYEIGGTNVLSSTTLGTTVVNSSLTSVGTLTQLQVSGVSTFQSNVNLGDNDKILLGDSNDLQIYHDGSNSIISDSGTGNLAIAGSNGIILYNAAFSELLAVFNTNGSVELYYDNSKEFETTGYGATVFGILQTQGLQVNSGVSTVGFLTATSIWNAGITTSARLTLNGANSTTTGGGQIYLNGATGNRIDFNTNGVAAPSFTTRSAGTKIVLYPNISGSDVDFAFGVDTNTLWSSVPNSFTQFKWYAGTTQLADLKGSGELVIGSTSLTGTASQTLQVTGGAYVSGFVGIGTTNPTSRLFVTQSGTNPSTAGEAGAHAFALSSGNTGRTMWMGYDDNIDAGYINVAKTGQSRPIYLQTRNLTNATTVFVGIGTTQGTGTANQYLQVGGGAYVSGNLGVGATNPGNKLVIAGETAQFPISLQVLSTLHATSRRAAIGLGGTIGAPSPDWQIVTDTQGNGTKDLTFYSTALSSNVFNIQTSGNSVFANFPVIIGTGASTGTASQQLQVNTGGAYVSGNLGVGRTNPSALLHLTGGSAIGFILERNSTGESYIRYQNSSGTMHAGISTGATFWGIGDSTNFTNSPYFVVRNTTGSVGIGTTNPQSTLQVKDALAFETTNTTTTTTSQVAVDSFGITTFRSAKYQAQITCPGQISVLGGITTGGRGYTAGTYNVTFTTSSGNGSAAQGTLVVSNGTVGQIGLGTTGGSGYVTGDVLTASGGSGLQVSVASTASPTGRITGLTLSSAGIGYTGYYNATTGTGTTSFTFLGGTGTGAVGLATIFDGVITSSTLLQQPTTGTGGTTYYSGSNYSTASVLSITRSDLTNTITTITGSVGVSTFTSLTAHGIGVSDVVRVSSTSNGLTAGTDYYVVTVPTTTTFTLGSAVGVGTTFTTGSSLSIGFFRNSARDGGQVAYTNAISGVSTNHQVSDLMVLQNGTTADFVEYATIANDDILGTFAADISGANARLLFTPTYPNNNIKVARQAITV
jgi:hypothetical protein